MIYLFNPSTDLALASGKRFYTPPGNVASFERRNMFLPAMYASTGDAVLMLYDATVEDRNRKEDLRLLGLKDLNNLDEPLSPWGWNLPLRNLLMRHGYPERHLPTELELDCWRKLAHRRVSMVVNRLIGVAEEDMPHEFTDVAEALEHVRIIGNVMLKMPWSSSGRGVMAVERDEMERAKKRIQDSISKQGSIMIESFHVRRCDFATEWISDGKSVVFLGFSMFETDECGRYKGNVIGSQECIIRELSDFTSGATLLELPDILKPSLERCLIEEAECPYIGPFGVDALVDDEGKIVGCVEINLRRTMGHVALDVFNRHPCDERKILRTE